MPDLSTYIGITPVSVRLTNAAVTRGVRLVRDSSGTVSVAAVGVRGDYVSITEGAANEVIMAVPTGTPAKVPAMASEAVTVGALAYSAANGKFSVTATSAVVVGRWVQAATGDNVLGEVQLFTNPAA